MDNLISRLSEIRSQYNCFNESEEPYYRALSEVIKMLLEQADGDTISRQAAIDALGEKPLAWTEGEYELGLQNQWQSDVDALKALPSAQPEPIRCKDCKHRDAKTGFCEGRGWPMQLVPDDGFCDKGERSEE